MPHVMMLGSPRPRKLRPDSNRMADEMVRVATMTSGGLFTFILKLILDLPLHVWIYAMLPVVAIIGLLNGLITFFLYAPVRKLFYFQEDEK